MYKGKSVAVVVPAHNEETQIARVIATMPAIVDAVFVVDDASSDNTRTVAAGLAAQSGGRVRVIGLDSNQGVGGAIETGYRASFDDGFEIAVVMAGDGQMDPADLPALLEPVAAGAVDYAKGNRLVAGDAWSNMPKRRFLGNAALSFFTKIVSGYWHVADSQTGYTAINRAALEKLLAAGIYNRFGMPNDVLVKLNVHDFRVRDVPIRPVYNVGEQSKLRIPRVIVPISLLLVRLFFYRMWHKYIVRDTHPLVLFYCVGFLLLPVGLLWAGLIVMGRLVLPNLLGATAGFTLLVRMFATDGFIQLSALCIIMGMQMLLFAMWFDMANNEHLR